jgi:hypothetical protein
MVRTLLSLTLIPILSFGTRPVVPEQRELTGLYICDGVNPDGTPYRGFVEIVRNDETFRVRWRLASRVSYIGIGILSEDVLAVSYYGGMTGLAVYRVAGDRLVGSWTLAGADSAIYSETLTKVDGRVRPPADEREPIKSRPAGADDIALRDLGAGDTVVY